MSQQARTAMARLLLMLDCHHQEEPPWTSP